MATITRMKEQIADLEARVADLEKQAKPARAAKAKSESE